MSGEKVLILDDQEALREMLTWLFTKDGYLARAVASGEEGLDAYNDWQPDVILTDLNMPGMDGLEFLRRVGTLIARDGRVVPVILITAYGSVDIAVKAMKEGAYDYVGKPFLNDELRTKVARALDVKRMSAENDRMHRELGERYHLGQFVGNARRMVDVYQVIRQVMGSRINCLVAGESGTGKELVARAIHYGSDRKRGPFVPVNCGAIANELFESELFGHKRGSFTGAVKDKIGMFEAANGGTLFLDEVGEMPLAMQVKMLRALQERKVTPVGGTGEVSVDVRIVAATNRNLVEEVKAGRFREDLFYRLNVVQIDMPPLRDRKEDIPALVQHFIERFSSEYGKTIRGVSPESLAILTAYRYPGNVRELQNIIERAVVLSEGSVITPAALPERIHGEGFAPAREEALHPEDAEEFSLKGGIDLEARLLEVERRYLMAALAATGGNRTQAAKLLGITFRSFRHRLAKVGVAGESEE